MASLLPPVPRLIFSVVEPISLVAGFCGAVHDPEWFVAQQIPQPEASGPVGENSTMVACQLGNLYLLMAFMGLAILNTTSEAKVVRAYLFVLWLGDIGHVGFTVYGLGMDRIAEPLEWNAVTMGNITFTVFLFLMRSAYFLGLFGADRSVVPPSKKKI